MHMRTVFLNVSIDICVRMHIYAVMLVCRSEDEMKSVSLRPVVDSGGLYSCRSGAKYPDTFVTPPVTHATHTVTRYLLLNFVPRNLMCLVYPPDGRRVYGSIELKS